MSDFEFIGKYISFLYRYELIYLDKELEPYNIKSGHFFVLMPLFKNDGINQESISQIIHVDKATVTRAIQKLIDEDYVYRERDEKDKRSYRVFITEKGKAIQPEIISIAQRWDDILLSQLVKDQRNMIKKSFDTMIENVSRD